MAQMALGAKSRNWNIIWSWGLPRATSQSLDASEADGLQRAHFPMRDSSPGKGLLWPMTDRDSPGFLPFPANIYFWRVGQSTSADSIH